MRVGLELDEQQEFRTAMRKMTALGELMWEALLEIEVPDLMREQMFTIWWTSMFTPKLEMPDFSKLFNQGDGD